MQKLLTRSRTQPAPAGAPSCGPTRCCIPAYGRGSSRRGVRTAAAGSAANRVRLGDSDLEVSECCLGTMTWGGSQNTEADAHEQLNYAFDTVGLNFLDTAEIYPVPPSAATQGNTDRYIGSWLAGRRREDVVLASKVSGYGRQTYLRKDGSTPRVDGRNIVESVDASLTRLNTTHIDLLQVHWVSADLL